MALRRFAPLQPRSFWMRRARCITAAMSEARTIDVPLGFWFPKEAGLAIPYMIIDGVEFDLRPGAQVGSGGRAAQKTALEQVASLQKPSAL